MECLTWENDGAVGACEKGGVRWLSIVLLVGCTHAPVGERSDAVVYGSDDRVALDPGAHPELAEALAGLVPAERLSVEGDRVVLAATTMAERLGGPLCEGERFASELSLADCSAVLVAPDAVLTAAHCVPSDATCTDLRVVFGYRREGDVLAPIDPADVHRCVAREDERPALDLVRLRLERDTGRTPLPLGRAAAGDAITVAGHPAGGPALVESLEVDRREGEGFVFYADVEDGSSGSPVVSGGALVGVVVAGETDYEWAGECFAARRLADGEGEGAFASNVSGSGGCQVAAGPPVTPLLALALLATRRGRRRSRRRGASADCGHRPGRRAPPRRG